ncbi:protein translocase subunit SecF [Cognatilysobacter tabacisoli]|uniref:protein translocase subunit SecF n=1 Tax=Cognatilysobacter tabacisoli TaxID=2315424 RepID=UPI000E6B25CF|nr:protein translocase subunit SecF [Lysobacter tabacisoli]
MKPFNVFPYDSKFDFMRLRWVSLGIAVALLLVAIGAMVVNSLPGNKATEGQTFNFALDFTGGALVELRFQRPVEVDDIRARLASAGFENAQVQNLGAGSDISIRQKTTGSGDANVVGELTGKVVSAVQTPDDPVTVLRSETVGAQVGAELAQNGIWALIFVIVGFLIYISFRFEKKFAIAAVLTTLHDVVIVLGWFAITGHEFDLTVLAGVLSVMGFSINDTIVVFDRVRENFRSMRADPITVLNKSINQTLSRTVITSFVALLTVVALYLYGGGSLRGMAEAQIVGIVLGTVSTIFVACPLLLWFGASKQDLLPKARDEEALARRP